MLRIERLQRGLKAALAGVLRTAASAPVERGDAPAGRLGPTADFAPITPGKKPPLLVRDPTGELVANARALGISPSLTGRLADALEPIAPRVKKLATELGRSKLATLRPAIQELVERFAALAAVRPLAEQEEAMTQIVALVASCIDRAAEITPRRMSAVRDAMDAYAELSGPPQFGAMGSTIRELLSFPEVDALCIAAAAAKAEVRARISTEVGANCVAEAFTVALATVSPRHAPEANVAAWNPAEQGILAAIPGRALTELQAERAVVGEALGAARRAFDDSVAGFPARAKALKELAALADAIGDRLAPRACEQWFRAVATANASPIEALVTGIVMAEALRRAQDDAPVVGAEQDVLVAAAKALAAVDGLTVETVVALPAALALCSNAKDLPAFVQRFAATVAMVELGGTAWDAQFAASIGQGINSRTKLDNAPASLELVGQAFDGAQLAGAPDNYTCMAAEQAPVVADALAEMEPGQAREILRTSFTADLVKSTAASVDVRTVLADYPKFPAELIPHAVAIGGDSIAVVGKLGGLFGPIAKSRDDVRALRSFLVLAQAGGGDVLRLIDQLALIKKKPRVVASIARMLLQSSDGGPIPKATVKLACDKLAAGENLVAFLESQRQQAKLRVGALPGVEKLKITEAGREEVEGTASVFFTRGKGAIDDAIYNLLLSCTLEGRFDEARFMAKATKPMMKRLGFTADGEKKWRRPLVLSHVTFDPAGEAEFNRRVTVIAKLAAAALEGAVAKVGPLAALETRYHAFVTKLRGLRKDKGAARQALLDENRTLRHNVEALRWLQALAHTTPNKITPTRFTAMAAGIRFIENDEVALRFNALMRTNDLSYSEVITYDNPSISELFALATTNCMSWQTRADARIVAYFVDANKRVIVTKTSRGERRRTVSRWALKESGVGAGKKVLALEMTYPDNAGAQEKRYIIEHAIVRAQEQGAPVTFPAEYYWQSHLTARFGAGQGVGRGAGYQDTEGVLRDLCARYGLEMHEENAQLRNIAGNTPVEYIDSALPDEQHFGHQGIRERPGNAESVYSNRFITLVPKSGGAA